MPSPFPGMDPYLEASDIWPDFHDRLATSISNELNVSLPRPYYARLAMRPEVGILEETPRAGRRIVPDVAVARARRSRQRREKAGGVAVLDGARTRLSPSIEVVVETAPLRHHFVEIRDPTKGHKLITLIEMLSPSCKKPGVDRKAYEQKQREILDSDASLMELDLLRAGERALPNLKLAHAVDQLDPPPDYLVLVNCAWGRVGDEMAYQLFPFSVRDSLPCIPVPLRQQEDAVPLDLQWVFHRAYETGPYLRGAVDYSGPPQPPLAKVDATWAKALLRGRVSSRL